MKRRICFPMIFAALVFSAAFSAADQCHADVITFEMSGTVEVSDPWDLLPDDIVSDMPFTARLTYDLDTPDSNPDDPQRGIYKLDDANLARELSFVVGDLTLTSDPLDDFQLEVRNGIPPNTDEPYPGDSFLLRSVSFNSDLVTELPAIQFLLHAPDGSALQTDALPDSLIPSDFETTTITVLGLRIDKTFVITGTITDVQIVPEPATSSLLTASIFTIFFWWRQGKGVRNLFAFFLSI